MKKFLLILLTATLTLLLVAVPAFATDSADVESEAKESNLFEDIYGELLKHSDKILSALAFAGSLILAITYKKGLLPLVKGALTSLGNSVSRLKEQTENAANTADVNIKSAIEKLDKAENLIFSLTEKLSALEAELEAAKKERAESGDVHTVIRTQVDMLYDIFMSSSIPLYQKEAVGERISEMKKTLQKGAEEKEND